MPPTENLKSARSKCLTELASRPASERDDEKYLDGLVQSIDTWFEAYKGWEKTDDFKVAFEERRMTARTDNKGNLKSLTREYNVRSNQGENVDMKIVLGFIGVKMRTMPKKFLDRGKYDHGLHPLSAVLLDSTDKISAQLFHKDADVIVFMPLPFPEDMRVYRKLKDEELYWGETALHARLIKVRRRMTRVRMASGRDMESTYYNVGSYREPKIRLGFSKYRGGGLDENVIEKRLKTARKYIKRLPHWEPHQSGHNELTIMYRSHEGKFPLLAEIKTRGGQDENSREYYYEETDVMGFGTKRTVDDSGRCELSSPSVTSSEESETPLGVKLQ